MKNITMLELLRFKRNALRKESENHAILEVICRFYLFQRRGLLFG